MFDTATSYEIETHVFCALLWAAAMFSFTRTLPLRTFRQLRSNGGQPHMYVGKKPKEKRPLIRISSTSLWIPQKFMCRGWSSWLFNPFSMNPFEEFCHTDSFSLSNPLYFCERTQTDTDICCLNVYLSSLTFLNQKKKCCFRPLWSFSMRKEMRLSVFHRWYVMLVWLVHPYFLLGLWEGCEKQRWIPKTQTFQSTTKPLLVNEERL